MIIIFIFHCFPEQQSLKVLGKSYRQCVYMMYNHTPSLFPEPRFALYL